MTFKTITSQEQLDEHLETSMTVFTGDTKYTMLLENALLEKGFVNINAAGGWNDIEEYRSDL